MVASLRKGDAELTDREIKDGRKLGIVRVIAIKSILQGPSRIGVLTMTKTKIVLDKFTDDEGIELR